MTAVMFYKEVPITAQSQSNLCQPALQRCLLVPHLMPEIQAKTERAAGRQNDSQSSIPGQIVGTEKNDIDQKADPQNGHQSVGHITVVAIGLEGGNRLFRRITQIFSQHAVQHGDYDVAEQGRQPQPDDLRRHQHIKQRTDQCQPWHHQRKQPKAAFAVHVA